MDDQREASRRTDVAVFVSDQLKEPVKISGQPVVNLKASTSGTDSDWVVKVIDVYPDEVAGEPLLGGYRLAVKCSDLHRASSCRRSEMSFGINCFWFQNHQVELLFSRPKTTTNNSIPL